MSVYWRNVKMGQNLIIENDKGHEDGDARLLLHAVDDSERAILG